MLLLLERVDNFYSEGKIGNKFLVLKKEEDSVLVRIKNGIDKYIQGDMLNDYKLIEKEIEQINLKCIDDFYPENSIGEKAIAIGEIQDFYITEDNKYLVKKMYKKIKEK